MEKFDQACELIRLYRGDPIAALDAVLDEDPDLRDAPGPRAPGILVQQTDKAYCGRSGEELDPRWRCGATATSASARI